MNKEQISKWSLGAFIITGAIAYLSNSFDLGLLTRISGALASISIVIYLIANFKDFKKEIDEGKYDMMAEQEEYEKEKLEKQKLREAEEEIKLEEARKRLKERRLAEYEKISKEKELLENEIQHKR